MEFGIFHTDMPYNHQQIEKKWQEKWDKSDVFQAKDKSDKEKFYCLVEFPYPSGVGLHVGHVRTYAGLDIVARKKRMEGKNVLFPMGWDAFGLPTENYAIKTGRSPQDITKENTDIYRRQMKSLGLSFDWSREINTTDPAYYRWTQWMFLQFFKKGLAYKKKMPINWCLSCKIGLANEEVVGGKCERCGGEVEKRDKEQWMMAITKYADRLLEDLKTVNYLPKIKKQQEEWIGRSEGAEVSFHLSPGPSPKGRDGIPGYVTTDGQMWNLLHDKSLEMRKNSTKSEGAMWEMLRRDAAGYHFRRQQIIGGFIVDFVCLIKKLVIEVDGDIHDYQKEEDENRTKFLNERGFEVIRFKNNEVLGNSGYVIETIIKKLKETPDVKVLPFGEDLGEVEVLPFGEDLGEVNSLPFGEGMGGVIKVFTTRPDTLFGATYMVLAPEHSVVSKITTDEQRAEVEKYVATSKAKTDIERGDDTKEKTGVFTGAYAVNPANGEEIPIWVADYVLIGYGTGAIMAVPAHDERDFAFATKYNLPIKQVVAPHFIDPANPPHEGLPEIRRKNVHVIIRNPKDNKILLLNWFSNLTASRPHLHTFIIGGIEGDEDLATAAIREASEETGYKNFKFIKDVGFEVHTEYFTEHKGQNRYAEIRVAVVDLIDDVRDEIPAHELKNHEPVWFDESEVEKTVNVIDGPMIWSAYKNGMPVFSDDGVAIHSDFLNGLPTWKAIEDMISWLEEKGLGARKVQYKLRDWIFSRQRYWGEPIPLVHCETCKNKIEKEALRISFYRQDMWSQLVLGQKIVETRALNPEEPERYFGNVGVGKYLRAVNKITGEEKYFRVTKVRQFKNLEELMEAQELLSKIWPEVREFTLENRQQEFAKYTPDYLERIEKNGLIAWQVEMVTPGIISIPESELPLELPKVEHYEPTDTGESPLAAVTDWVNTKCPECDGPAKRETDTMPNWAGSSWYFLRYLDPKNDQIFAAPEKLKYWMPVDLYNGGMEHTTLHLLYSRFWNKFLFDQGFVPVSEPYTRRHSQGLILASDNNKMSKSRGNVVNPDDIVAEYGADTLRTYEAFIGPFEEPAPWNENGVVGVRRFLERVTGLVEMIAEQESKKVTRALHQTIKKVTEDIDNFRFNTAVAQMMTFVNVVFEEKGITKESFLKFVRVLCPFAPHLANEIFEKLGEKNLIEAEAWPEFDSELVKEDEITIAIQVNGKLRGTVTVPAAATEEEIKNAATAEENVKKYLEGKEVIKTIFVPGKLMNIVIK